jgi:hypothetical protein
VPAQSRIARLFDLRNRAPGASCAVLAPWLKLRRHFGTMPGPGRLRAPAQLAKGRAMAARALASVTVSFGMVSIPVKLYAATQAQAGISFNLLHKACGSRLRQQYTCIRENVVVERADMVKG